MSENYNYSNSREWMYRRIDAATGIFSQELEMGMEQFMAFANNQPLAQCNGGKFHCPCNVCKNVKPVAYAKKIWSHLYSKGFMPDYYVWYKHGEEIGMDLGTSYVDRTHISGSEDVGNYVVEDRYVDMVNDNFETSDGTSQTRGLTIDKENEIFLQSTFANEKGSLYGVGSLAQTHVNGKRKYPGSCASFSSLQQQLEEAKRQIEVQAAVNTQNAALEKEFRQVSATQQAKIDQLTLVERYLSETDPRFLDYLAANRALRPTDADHSTAAYDPTTINQ